MNDDGVSPLLGPMPPELSVPVRADISPLHYFQESDLSADLYAAPAGSLAFCGDQKTAHGGDVPPPGGISATRVVVNLPGPVMNDFSGLRVFGVVLSPIEDPELTARHPDELSCIAVSVAGTHTILAAEEDTADVFPLDRISVDWTRPWKRLSAGASTFFVPRLVKEDPGGSTAPAFAVVLQRGSRELRIMLLNPAPLL